MAIAVTVAIPLTALVESTPVTHTLSVPATGGYTTYFAELSRTISGGLNAAATTTTVTLEVDMSADGGVTWRPLLSAVANGGNPSVGPSAPSTTSASSTSAPIAGNALRVVLTANAAVSVSGAFEAS